MGRNTPWSSWVSAVLRIPFYTGQQVFVDTAGRVDKFQQRLAKTKEAQEKAAAFKKRKR